MVFNSGFRTAIVAIYQGSRVYKFFWHGLCLDSTLKPAELPFHIDNTSTTYRASVRAFHVFIVASMVYAMATSHENHCLR